MGDMREIRKGDEDVPNLIGDHALSPLYLIVLSAA